MLLLTDDNDNQQNQQQQKMKNSSSKNKNTSNEVLKFKKLNEAIKKIPQGHTLFRNESSTEFVFQMLNDNQILDVVYKKNQSLHLHEILGKFVKIFFDIDLKICDVLIDNEITINYIQKLNILENLRTGDFDTIQDELFIKGKQGSLLECFIIYNIQRLISIKFAQLFKEIENEYYILDNAEDVKFLDTLFDTFRSSRSAQNKTKISWHLTFLPDMYCMEILNLKKVSQLINDDINSYFNKFFEPLNKELKQNGFEEIIVKDCLDIQVYKKNGSIRFVNCLKFKSTTGRKKYIETDKNNKQLQNENFREQLPARFLISKIQTQQGESLNILTYEQELQQDDQQDECVTIDFQDCPLSEKDIQKILIKQNIFNAIIDKPQRQGDIFHLRIKNKFKSCILCDRVHENDNMYAIINNKLQYIEFRCFRQKGSKGLKFDFEGNKFGISQSINDIHKNMPQIIHEQLTDNDAILTDYHHKQLQNEETKSIVNTTKSVGNTTKSNNIKSKNLSQLGKTSQIKQEEILKLNKEYFLKHETVDLKDLDIQYQEVNVSELEEFPTKFRKLYIKSHMGTAKTKRLLQYIHNYIMKFPQNVIYIMSFRITFAEDLTQKINNYLEQNGSSARFVSYLSLKSQRTLNQQYLIVQVESLNKINMQNHSCDLLILDESESIFEQLTSKLSQKESVNFSVFVQLSKDAKQVICMDAYLSQRTICLMEQFSKNDINSDIQIYQISKQQDCNRLLIEKRNLQNYQQSNNCQIEEIDEQYNSKSILIKNNWQRQKTYILYQSQKKQDLWLADILNAYHNGENIVIPCNNATVAETVYKLLFSIVSETERCHIQIYTQKLNKQEKERDLLDLNESWKKYRILIYSPTISAGISYELSHFNRVFAYFDIRSTNLETFFQMMGRVRNISTNSYHILLTGGEIYNPCSLEMINKQIIQNISDSCQMIPAGLFFTFNKEILVIQNNTYYQLIVHNMRISNLTTSSPTQRFIFLAGDNSIIQIRTPQQGAEYQYKLLNLVNDLRDQKFDQMKNSPLVTQITEETNYFEIEKYHNIKEMGLSKQNAFYLENIPQQSHMMQWIRKYRYIRFRLQYGQFKEYIKFQKQMTQSTQINNSEKMDIIREIVANSQERLLELILQMMGLNWDILDIQKCQQHSEVDKHTNYIGHNQDKLTCQQTASQTRQNNKSSFLCSCNKQLNLNIYNNIRWLINDHSQVQFFCRYIKNLQLPIGKSITRILLKSSQNAKNQTHMDKSIKLTIRTFKKLLSNYFGIQLIKYQKEFTIIKHMNQFDQFLVNHLQQSISHQNNHQNNNQRHNILNEQQQHKQDKYFKIQKILIQYISTNKHISNIISSSLFLQSFEQNLLQLTNQIEQDNSNTQQRNQHTNIWDLKIIKELIKQLDLVRSNEDLYNILAYLNDRPNFVQFAQILYLTGYVQNHQQNNKNINYSALIQDYNYYNDLENIFDSIKQQIRSINDDFNNQQSIY